LPARESSAVEQNIAAKMVPTATFPTLAEPASTDTKRFLRILYADDMQELRDIARISFSRDGHGIECVADGLLALARVTADPGFDLVVTDHHMPNMNGLELVGHLRERGFTGKLMVFCSELDPQVAAHYQRLGVDRVLYKPVFPSELRQVIRELFPNAAQAAKTISARR
jgi:two-component system, chemotaxis family, chemotaxis protein CheY